VKPEVTTVNVILVGRFNPADFALSLEPMKKAVMPEKVSDLAYETFLPGQVVIAKLSWGKFSILQNQISIEASSVPYVQCLDFLTRLIHDVSPSSVVTKFGINLICHYRFLSIQKRDELGIRLVPPANWGNFGKDVESSFSQEVPDHGGLMKAVMRRPRNGGQPFGWKDVIVEPSAIIDPGYGVALTINDHFEPNSARIAVLNSERAISDELVKTLVQVFEKSVEDSLAIGDDIFK
jgi:hypothetical protein